MSRPAPGSIPSVPATLPPLPRGRARHCAPVATTGGRVGRRLAPRHHDPSTVASDQAARNPNRVRVEDSRCATLRDARTNVRRAAQAMTPAFSRFGMDRIVHQLRRSVNSAALGRINWHGLRFRHSAAATRFMDDGSRPALRRSARSRHRQLRCRRAQQPSVVLAAQT